MRYRKSLVAALALTLVVTGCGGGDQEDGFSPAIRDAYMQGCTTDQNEAFCSCTVDELEKRFTQAEFVRYAIEASETPPDPEVFVEVAMACLRHADTGG